MKNNTKKLIINLLLLFIFTALLPTNYTQAASKSKDVLVKSAPTTSVQQGDASWCWAAALCNVNKILTGKSIQLKKMVEYGKTKNPNKPITDTSTSKPGNYFDIKRAFNKLNIKYSHKYYSISFDAVMKEINAGRPIYILTKNHALTIIGYNKSDQKVIYLDSNYTKRRTCKYKDFKNSKQYGRWMDTYSNLKLK